MAPKRQTIDGLSARVRPRTYADMHTPTPRRIVNDIQVKQHIVIKPTITEENKIERQAINSAKLMIGQYSKVATQTVSPIQAQTPTPKVQQMPQKLVERPASLRPPVETMRPAHSIAEMLQSIQGPVESAPDTASQHPHEDIDEKRNSLRDVVSRMFENKRSITITTMSLLLMVGGVVALVSSFTTNKIVGEQVQALTEVASVSIDNESLASDEGLPSEDPVPESVVNAFTTPADEPRYIDVPKLKNKKTRVLKMGLDGSNSIKTPRTTWDTGWYEGSSKPGDSVGSALIVGHVSGLTSGGVFYNLYRLVEGDEIKVEMGDGTIYTYRVVGKEEVPLDGINMNNYLISKDIDKPGLTLMTCAGEYNPVTETYDNRLAIFAVRDK
jgi:sortase (surface protein transpeptidase)